MTSSRIQEIEKRLSDYDAATVTFMQGIERFREYAAAREQLYFNRLHSQHNPAFEILAPNAVEHMTIPALIKICRQYKDSIPHHAFHAALHTSTLPRGKKAMCYLGCHIAKTMESAYRRNGAGCICIAQDGFFDIKSTFGEECALMAKQRIFANALRAHNPQLLRMAMDIVGTNNIPAQFIRYLIHENYMLGNIILDDQAFQSLVVNPATFFYCIRRSDEMSSGLVKNNSCVTTLRTAFRRCRPQVNAIISKFGERMLWLACKQAIKESYVSDKIPFYDTLISIGCDPNRPNYLGITPQDFKFAISARNRIGLQQ